MKTTSTTPFNSGSFFSNRSFALVAIRWLAISATLLATGAWASQLTVSWTDASNDETGFKIERSSDCATFIQIATVDANVTTYIDTSLVSSTMYCYRLRAYNAYGDSDYSNVASATTPATNTAPAITTPPVTQTVTAGADVGFTVVATGTAPLSYQWQLGGNDIAGATSDTYFLSNVQAADAGAYSVVVANDAGSASSADATLTVNAVTLTAPTGLTPTAGNTQAALSWTAASGATSYNVKRATVSGGPYATIASDVTTTGYTDTGLSNGTAYYYAVSAVYAGGESLNSAEVSATPGSLPSPWQTRDIGTVAATGSADYSSGTFTEVGSGADIWGRADAFRFVYQVGTGDCEISARVVTVQNANAWSKAGVMIRGTLNANTRHAMVVVTPGNGVAFQSRTSTGSSSTDTHTTGLTAPYWVRVVRSGNMFTAYNSTDGSSWTSMGSVMIAMGTNVYIGLAVTSHNNGTLCTATFDNLEVTP